MREVIFRHIQKLSFNYIVGESGAGKSTIVSLIPRFYEPQKGCITFDGHDIMDLKQRFLRENIGLVQQNVFLFDGTIRDNIMYGKPEATEEEMMEAAQVVPTAAHHPWLVALWPPARGGGIWGSP